jgi:hypothetical protein
MVASTWATREIPFLDATVRFFDQHPTAPWVTVGQIAELAGMDPLDAVRAAKALRWSYIDLDQPLVSDAQLFRVRSVTNEARRVVGQWPTPESVVEQIAHALIEAADREPDEQKRSRLRALGEGLLGFGKDVAANAVANAAMLPFTGG